MTAAARLPNGVLRLLARPQVRHSLPGRVRIHVPFLAGLRSARTEIVDLIADLVRVPEEIHTVEGNPLSGTVLIRYDADRADERDVLDYLRALFEIYLANRRVLDRLPADRRPEVRDRLVRRVRGALRHRLTLDPRLEIGEDVLA